jgi:hypothetical protein
MKTVDEMLANFTTRLYLEGGNNADKITKDYKSQLLKAVLEVIGEDEPEEVEYDETTGKQTDLTLVIRNQLKAEQRKRAKELFGVKE